MMERALTTEKAADLASKKIDMMTGIGDAMQDKGGKAAESIASGVGTVVQGVERGIMKSNRKVSAEPSLEAAGLAITKVQNAAGAEAGDAAHGLDAYVVASAAAAGTLRMIAYDRLDREIGRSSAQLAFDADQADYVLYPLGRQIELQAVASVTFRFTPAGRTASR